MFDTLVDAQKELINNWKQSTEKMQEAFTPKEGENSTDLFKKWYNNQMDLFTKAGESMTNGTDTKNPTEFFNNWFNQQLDMNKNLWETMNKNVESFTTSGTGDWTKFWNNNNGTTFNGWMESFNNTFGEMMKNFKPGTSSEAFNGMFNTTNTYMQMWNFWMPMFQNMQNKSFTPEWFKNFYTADKFKTLVDNMFKFSPEGTQEMFKNWTSSSKEQMTGMNDMFTNWMNNSKEAWAKMMPGMDASMFTTVANNYNNMMTQMKDQTSPFFKMMTPGADKDNMEAMANMNDLMANWAIKYSQFQYMTYTTGMKAGETFATKAMETVQNNEGETIDFMDMFKMWLGTIDSEFVALYDTDEFTGLQTEFSSLTMKLKKQQELMMEKSFAFMPLINRTEMDDLYKTVYEMNKRIKSLEKQLTAATKEATAAAPKKTAAPRKTATKSTTTTTATTATTTTK